MIAITITTIVMILALVALVVGGLMWEQQNRRDTTADPEDPLDSQIAQHQRRIQLYRLALHQLRLDQLERERDLVNRSLHPSNQSHQSHN